MPAPARSTAILVVDLQRDFCAADGALARMGADPTRNAKVVAAVPAFLAPARAAGALVVWVRQVARPEHVTPARLEQAARMGRDPLAVCRYGTRGAELADGLVPDPADVCVEKGRYSAFVGTALHQVLRAHRRDAVVVCGTAANVCVDSTVRDAYQADLPVTVLEDLVGWTRPDLAVAALATLAAYFGEVRSARAVLADWDTGPLPAGSDPAAS